MFGVIYWNLNLEEQNNFISQKFIIIQTGMNRLNIPGRKPC